VYREVKFRAKYCVITIPLGVLKKVCVMCVCDVCMICVYMMCMCVDVG